MNKIITGVINHIFDNEDVSDLAKNRISTCLSEDKPYPHCRYYNPDGIIGPKCDACGCVLKFKSKSPTASCPINKWEK